MIETRFALGEERFELSPKRRHVFEFLGVFERESKRSGRAIETNQKQFPIRNRVYDSDRVRSSAKPYIPNDKLPGMLFRALRDLLLPHVKCFSFSDRPDSRVHRFAVFERAQAERAVAKPH